MNIIPLKPQSEAGDAGIDRHTVLVTFFKNKKAMGQATMVVTLSQLAKGIGLTTEPEKFALPWLKLARFGGRRSDKNCLRTDINLQAISGVEVEHDAGSIPFETAVATMLKARIRCLIYTSPSWKQGEKEKWRILLPTSKELPPERRAQLVARVNGETLFNGEITNESFVLSQAYLYGHLPGADHHEVVIDGDFIDQRRDLDAGALGKLVMLKGANYIKNAETRSGNYVSPCRSDEEIFELLKQSILRNRRGEKQWHNTMISATASMIGRGWSDQQIYAATAEYCDAGWGDPDIKEMVEGARRKWGRPNPVDPEEFSAQLRELFAIIDTQQAATEAREEAELGRALDIWSQSGPVRKTIGMHYLRTCGIDAVPRGFLERLQFHEACPWDGGTAPALVALVVDDVSGHPIGVQITALDPRTGTKLGCEVIGTAQGGVIALSPAAHIRDELAVTVGIERALSARACGIELPIWAVLNLEGLADFPVLRPPHIPSAFVDSGTRHKTGIAALSCPSGMPSAARPRRAPARRRPRDG